MQYTGTVLGGSRKAQQLGFPTANIALTDTTPTGIYVASVTNDGQEYNAVAYADQTRHILEAHLLDYAGDLYGKEITISLLQKIRESGVYTTDDALKEAVAGDLIRARAYFEK